ncbi:MAG: PD-(D/E)XK nuclease family protein [Mariniblastus sp.]
MTQNSESYGSPTSNSPRIFLGLEQPPLISAVDWIVNSYQSEGSGLRELDLSQFIIVLPSTRAKQRLLQLLVQKTDEQAILFTPPEVTTVGQLPEHLYVAEKQLATDLAQQIAWSKAVEQGAEEEVKCLTGRHEVEDLQDWQPLATLISKLHTRLASDIWSFSSVSREVKKVSGFLKEETARWDALDAIQQRYYSILHEVDLWDKQAARNYAAGGLMKVGEIRCSTDKNILMVGAADLNRSVSEMIRQVATTNPAQVRVLIAAPESMAGRFDAFGSLITEQWLETEIEIDDGQILIVDQPSDQSDATAHQICKLAADQDLSADQITIGVPDVTIIPQIERSLNAIQVPHRNLTGRLLSETAPVRLMVACRDYLETQSYESYASLVRHPDMFRSICAKVENDSWIHELDVFQNFNLPSMLGIEDNEPFGSPKQLETEFDETDKGSIFRAKKKAESAALLNRIHAFIGELLSPLLGDPKPIAEWTQPWSKILVEVYGDRMMNKTDPGDRQIIKSCDAVYTALGNQKQVPEKFGTITTAAQALEWAVEAAMEHRVVDPPIPEAIELAGWLDLTLDDAPVMIVTSMNDEHVPASELGHQFLPNELCKKLKILDNDRRYARDVYALTVIASVRKHLILISGRRDEKGEPKKPSRLLFSTDAQTAARRAKAFFDYTGRHVSDFWITTKKEGDCPKEQQFEIPMPICTEPLRNLSVTKFRDFLKCPYRFYLNHILKLESTSDDWRELSGGTFGDLTHNVLEAFGKSDQRDLTSSEKILEFLNDELNSHVKRLFSGSRLPAVRIQVEQLRLRMEKFADQQANFRKQGWRIVSTEEHLFHDFNVDGEPFVINGKIDRVDQHDITGQVAVWDYKSSDKGAPPNQVHYMTRKKEWKDLQLPLYRHLVKEVSVVAGADFSNVKMGYILLPKKLDDVGFHEADWTADQLSAADETAKAVIRKIRGGVYWPPNEKPPMYSEEFAAICQDNVFEQYSRHVEEELEEAPPW